MKLRRVSFVERHAEKLFLALVALVFMGVLTFQFLGAGNVVKVDGKADTPIDRAHRDVAVRAERALQRIREASVDPQAEQPVPDLASTYASLLSKPEAPSMALKVPLGPAFSDNQGVSTGQLKEVATAPPEPPAPSRPTALPFVGALDPILVASRPELLDIAPALAKQQPFDIRAITVESVFDGAALKAALETDPDGDGPLESVPTPWWQALNILDVRLERREVNKDGTFGEPTLVPPPPGQFSLRDRLATIDARELRTSIAALARDNGGVIVRPGFYSTIAGEPWAPPSVASGAGAGGADGMRLQRELDDVNREIANIKRQLEGPDRSRSSSRAGDGGAVAGVGPARAPSSNRPRESGSSPSDGEARRRETLQKQLVEKESRRSGLEAQLKTLGASADGGDLASRVAGALQEPVRSLSSGPQVRIWAHDVTGRPGATYQYRMAVVIPNPLHGFDQSLNEATRALAQPSTIRSAESEWSDPVSVDEDAYLFITAARETPTLGGGGVQKSAAAEVYKLYYGYWRSVPVNLDPGDSAAGVMQLSGTWPDFKIRERGAGLFEIESQSPFPASLQVDSGGWSLVDVAGSPVDDELKEAVLATPGGALETRNPRTDRESRLLSRLRKSAQAAGKGVVQTPSSGMPGGKPVDSSADPGRTPEQRETERSAPPDRLPSIGG